MLIVTVTEATMELQLQPRAKDQAWQKTIVLAWQVVVSICGQRFSE